MGIVLWIGAGIAAVFVLLVIVGSVLLWLDKRAEDQIRKDGRPVAAALVMANNQFVDGEIESAPALVAIDLGQDSWAYFAHLVEIASRAYELYVLPPDEVELLDPVRKRVALAIQDDYFQRHRRTRLPDEFTGGREVYFADLEVHRERTHPEVRSHRLVPCLITGRAEGAIMQLPLEDRSYSLVSERIEQTEQVFPEDGEA